MNITIYLHNNKSFTTYIENYNSVEFAKQLNDTKNMVVAVGDVIVNKNSINMIAPSETEEDNII